MTQPPELDAETRARIEAEEAYRAEIRARPTTPPTVNKGRQNWTLLIVLGVLAFLFFGGSGVFNSLKGALPPPEGQPVGAEVQIQDTPDNYSLDLYATLKDAQGQEVAAAGFTDIEVYTDSFSETPRLLWTRRYSVRADQFSRGTRGQGAFQRDAVFIHLGSVSTTELHVSSRASVSVQMKYELMDNTTLEAKDTAMTP